MAGATMPGMGKDEGTALLIAGAIALVAVVYVVRKGAGVAKGALTGDNALTRSATEADGSATSAYVGQGPLGTVGAATNAVSGGWFSTLGDWLGGKAYDLTHSDPNATVNSPTATTDDGTFDFGYGATTPGGW